MLSYHNVVNFLRTEDDLRTQLIDAERTIKEYELELEAKDSECALAEQNLAEVEPKVF
jgi:hypothetical protein